MEVHRKEITRAPIATLVASELHGPLRHLPLISQEVMNELLPWLTSFFHTFWNRCPPSQLHCALSLWIGQHLRSWLIHSTQWAFQEIVPVCCYFQMMEKHKIMREKYFFFTIWSQVLKKHPILRGCPVICKFNALLKMQTVHITALEFH